MSLDEEKKNALLRSLEHQLGISSEDDLNMFLNKFDDFLGANKGKIYDEHRGNEKQMDEIRKLTETLQKQMQEQKEAQLKSAYEKRVLEHLENKEAFPHMHNFKNKEQLVKDFITFKMDEKFGKYTDENILTAMEKRFSDFFENYNSPKKESDGFEDFRMSEPKSDEKASLSKEEREKFYKPEPKKDDMIYKAFRPEPGSNQVTKQDIWNKSVESVIGKSE